MDLNWWPAKWTRWNNFLATIADAWYHPNMWNLLLLYGTLFLIMMKSAHSGKWQTYPTITLILVGPLPEIERNISDRYHRREHICQPVLVSLLVFWWSYLQRKSKSVWEWYSCSHYLQLRWIYTHTFFS